MKEAALVVKKLAVKKSVVKDSLVVLAVADATMMEPLVPR